MWRQSAPRRHVVGPALAAMVPALALLAGDLVVTLFSGRVEALGAAYQFVLPAAALARYAGMFVLAGASWWLLRRSGAGTAYRLLAIVSGPVAYGLTAAWHLSSWFPTGQALYYAVNPLTVAALGASAAAAAVAEMVWRRRASGRLLAGAALGWAVLYGTVLWDGGVHWFYIFQQGFRALFG